MLRIVNRTIVRSVVLGVVSAVALTACGSDDSGLSSVTVSKGKTPTVKVDKGFATDKTDTRVVAEGSGDEIKSGDVVKVNYVAVNGRTGKQFDNSFKADTPLTATLTEGSILPGFVKGLTGQKVGTRVLVAIPPKDGFDSAQKTLGLKKSDSMVFLFDIVAKVPTEASGTAKKLPAEAPKVVLKDGKPSGLKAGSKTVKNPKKSMSWVAIQGKGDKLKANQTISAQYVGQIFPKGKVFDSSWASGKPLNQPLSGLIKCWQQQLVGKTIGSRVILVCPASTAYKGTESELKNDTLTFAIDLLDAS